MGIDLGRIKLYLDHNILGADSSYSKMLERLHVSGVFIDLTSTDSISYSDIIEAFRRFGIVKVNDLNRMDAILLIDPLNHPKGLKDLLTLWKCRVALDLGTYRALDIFELAESYRSLYPSARSAGVRLSNMYITHTIKYIAAIVPSFTILDYKYYGSEHIRLFKLYTGASSGDMYIEVCLSIFNGKGFNDLLKEHSGLHIEAYIVRSC